MRCARTILEQKGLLPPYKALPHCVPRDEQFTLLPPGFSVFLMWDFDRLFVEYVLETLKNRLGKSIATLNGSSGDVWLLDPLPENERVFVNLSSSCFQLTSDGDWPVGKALPTHIFTLELEQIGQTASRTMKRFLHDHDDMIVHHNFREHQTASQVAHTIAFMLEHATVEKLDTRRYTWLPKEQAPKYSSKRIRRGELEPFSQCQPPLRVELNAKDLLDRYTVQKETAATLNSNIGSIDRCFDLHKFEDEKSPPEIFDSIVHRERFDHCSELYQCQDMLIKAPSKPSSRNEVLVPVELANTTREFLTKAMSHLQVHSKRFHEYYAYLTVSFGTVAPWQTQRRAGLHADGFISGKAGHSKLQSGKGRERNEIIYIACNALPPVFYLESFPGVSAELDRMQHDFWVAMATRTSRKPSRDCLKPYDIAMMDGYCLHSVSTNQSMEHVPRTFIRLIFSTERYEMCGNTKNPHFSYEGWNWVLPKRCQAPAAFWEQARDLF